MVLLAPPDVLFPRWPEDDELPPQLIYKNPLTGNEDYAFANSPVGVNHAASIGANAIDHDYYISLDGVMHNTHNPIPLVNGFKDISGAYPIGSTIHINQMTSTEIKNLRSVENNYMIRPLSVDAAVAANAGVTLFIEQKGYWQFAHTDYWLEQKAIIEAAGAEAVVMTLPAQTRAKEALRAAGMAGFRTLLLGRGPVPNEFYDFSQISAVKGPLTNQPDIRRGMVRLGMDPASATRSGCSVTSAQNVIDVKKAIAALPK